MTDQRLKEARSKVRKNVCVMIPKGTQITLCAQEGAPSAKKVRLASSWYVTVKDVEPEVEILSDSTEAHVPGNCRR